VIARLLGSKGANVVEAIELRGNVTSVGADAGVGGVSPTIKKTVEVACIFERTPYITIVVLPTVPALDTPIVPVAESIVMKLGRVEVSYWNPWYTKFAVPEPHSVVALKGVIENDDAVPALKKKVLCN